MNSECKAYRSGLRRALAELTALRVEAEGRVTEQPSAANRDRRRRAATYVTACRKVNELLDGRCQCGESHYRIGRRSSAPLPTHDEPLIDEMDALKIIGAIDRLQPADFAPTDREEN